MRQFSFFPVELIPVHAVVGAVCVDPDKGPFFPFPITIMEPYTITLKYRNIVFARNRYEAYDIFTRELRGAPGSYIAGIEAGSETKKKRSLLSRLIFGN